MRKSNHDGDAIAADLFADQIFCDVNSFDDSYPTEGFCNAYAEASQARASGRTSMPIGGHNSSRIDKSGAIGASDKDHHENSLVFEHIQPAVPQANSGKEKSYSTRLSGDHQGTGPTPRLMTVKEVAAYLGMSISKVWRLEKRGVGFPKAIHICGSTRWDRCAIDRYLDSLQAVGNSNR